MQTFATILLALSTTSAWRYFMARNNSNGRDTRTLSQTAGFFIALVLIILLPVKRMITDQYTQDIVIASIGIVSVIGFNLAEWNLRKSRQAH